MSKWVDVNDRMPTKDILYFIFGKRLNSESSIRHIYLGWFDPSCGYWINADTYDRLWYVSHWRHMIKNPVMEVKKGK